MCPRSVHVSGSTNWYGYSEELRSLVPIEDELSFSELDGGDHCGESGPPGSSSSVR